jgi:hypothetical protein
MSFKRAIELSVDNTISLIEDVCDNKELFKYQVCELLYKDEFEILKEAGAHA